MMDSLMNAAAIFGPVLEQESKMFEVLGYIFAVIILLVLAFFVYHVIKGAIVGASLMRWRLKTAGCGKLHKLHTIKNWPFKLVQLYFACWRECIFYDGDIRHRARVRYLLWFLDRKII